MKKKKKRFKRAIIALLLLAIFLFSPICASIRSYAVMYPYSCLYQRNSLLYKNKILFHIPGGNYTKKSDWYPFVITFNADEGLSAYLGESVEFTILYNFGCFDLRKGTSSYYDPESSYYSSFYGGYIVKPAEKSRKIGFQGDNTVNAEELAEIPEYDQKYLVLPSIGCPVEQREFNEKITSIQYNIKYAAYEDWVKIDSTIETNSPAHEYKGFQLGYLQYGRPTDEFGFKEDFPIINLMGRAYVRYFEEFQATVVLYAMAPSWRIIDEVDDEILSKSEIGFSDIK